MEENAPLGPMPPALIAQTGTHVIIELLQASGKSERLEFDIVPDESANFAEGFLGEGTPLARAILGKPAGSEVSYQQADITGVRILSVTPAQSPKIADLAQQREAARQKAQAEVERTSAILFASSFSGKWGDYDPEGIEHWENDDDKG